MRWFKKLVKMESEIKIWILVAVAGAMAAIIGFMIKVVTAQVLKRLDEMVHELRQLTQVSTVHREQIRGLQEQANVLRHRMHNHLTRIRALELGAAKAIS